jgi:Protein of unknown function (DUF1552)
MYTLTRRAFLRTFAGTSLAASTLRSFETWAQNGVFPRRLLIVYSSAGRDTDSYCSGTGQNYTLSPGYAPLQAWKSKLSLVEGLSIPAHINEEHPNGRCSMLTARSCVPSGGSSLGGGPSIDRFVANALSNGKSIYCGPGSTGPQLNSVDAPVSWLGAGAPNASYLDGKDSVLSALFPGGGSPVPMPGQTNGALLNEYSLNKHLIQEMQRLRKVAPKASVEKLELHLQALNQLRASLPSIAGDAGTSPPSATCNTSIPAALADQEAVNLTLAHAFACGQAQVAVVRMGGDDPVHTWSHWNDGPTYRTNLRALDRSYAESFGRLLGYLDQFPEGNGTVLNNTLVIWTTEVSGGYSGNPQETGITTHGVLNMPFMLAGGLGGKVKLGERLFVTNKTCGDLYRTVAEIMGVPGSTSFGDPKFGGTGLPDILT